MLKRLNRLTKEKDFNRVNKAGRVTYGQVLLIKVLKNELNNNRFGLIISNRVSKKATQRNLIKRRLREILRLNLNKIVTGFDIVIIISPKIITEQKVMAYKEMESAVYQVFKKANLIA